MESSLQEGICSYNTLAPKAGPVIYWMNRDQRLNDNRALSYAQEQAVSRQVPLLIFFCISEEHPETTHRHDDFMLKGLRELEKSAGKLNIPFIIRTGDPVKSVVGFCAESSAGMVVTDFSPLRTCMESRRQAAGHLQVPLHEVDAHNIIPCRWVSGKQEWAARTIRPKIHRLLTEYLSEIPAPVRHRWSFSGPLSPTDWRSLESRPGIDPSVKPVTWLIPGENGAAEHLAGFIEKRLSRYALDKNDPTVDGLSGLSPYLHFGQISAQRIALEVRKSGDGASVDAFIEELIVRKELSDNFCLYNQDYDRYEGIPAWAKKTLEKHWNDPRSFLYSLDQFENSATHDPLWNAAQKELVTTGKIHGYMRMYWAKKILEWTRNPEEAFHIAVFLNDRYSIDGRDPNGYAGIAWSIGGVHDRPWRDRPVFGTIRYMSYEGCRRKFDVDRYIYRWIG